MALRNMRSETSKLEKGDRRVFLIGTETGAPKEVLERIIRDKREHDLVKDSNYRPGAD